MSIRHRQETRPRGLMDKASDFGSEDSRFKSWRGRRLTFVLQFWIHQREGIDFISFSLLE